MDTADQNGHLNKSNFQHRKRCAKRVFIGPWDIHNSPVAAVDDDNELWSDNNPNSLQRQRYSSHDSLGGFISSDDESDGTDDISTRMISSQESVRPLHEEDHEQSQRPILSNYSKPVSATTVASSSFSTTNGGSNNSSPFMTPSSGGTSFLTARTRSTFSTVFHSVNSSLSSTPTNMFTDGMRRTHRLPEVDEDEDEPIDYQLLQSTDIITGSPPDLPEESESVLTIKASKNAEKQPMSHAKNSQYSLSEHQQLGQHQQQQGNNRTDEHQHHYQTKKSTSTTTGRLYPKRKKKKPLIWKKKSTSTSTLSLPSTTGTATPFSSCSHLTSTDNLPPTIIIAPEPHDPLLKVRPIKRDPMLCMRTVTGSDGTEPSQYKASREARYSLLTEEWKQVELVLTPTYITTYSSSTYFWPKQRIEHRIYLEGSKKPKKLELRLLSALDYTFCLRYQHQTKASKQKSASSTSPRMITTMTFKAESFLKCQEWYMELYNMLPAENKRPIPKYCEVYLPALDLTVNLPLTAENRKSMTMEDVKDAVLDVLEEERVEAEESEEAEARAKEEAAAATTATATAHYHQNEKEMVDLKQHHKSLLHHFIPHEHRPDDTVNTDDYGLCWTLGDRAEWIYWTHTPPLLPASSLSLKQRQQRRIDWAVCPQIIEQTHRLELRKIEHTPNEIVLSREANFVLKEPPPVEGFLTRLTDYDGSIAAGLFKPNRKTNYFATFDQFLFYVPESKVAPPNMSCLEDSDDDSDNDDDDDDAFVEQDKFFTAAPSTSSPIGATAAGSSDTRRSTNPTTTATTSKNDTVATIVKRRGRPYFSSITPYRKDVTSEAQAEEMARRMKLLTEAKGMIDLTEVSYVRRTFSHEFSDTDGGDLTLTKRSSKTPIISSMSRVNSSASKRRRGPIALPDDDDDDDHTENGKFGHSSSFFRKQHRRKPCLELVMENGLQIKFEVYSSDTCDLWVNYLAQLIIFWKARKEAEKEAHSQYTNVVPTNACDNLDQQKDKSSNQGVMGKQIVSRDEKVTDNGCIHRQKEVQADTRLWSYCMYEQCRDIVKSGVLYYKPHRRGTYSQKICLLTVNGWLLFYDVYHRSSSKPRCNHEKKGAIDISGCYFYSGLDCSKQKKGSNNHNQESDSLLQKTARIYSSGLSTDDDPLTRIFSIWKPKIRRYFSTKRKRITMYRPPKDQQWLNPKGQTWTFLAQSRTEKEEWVCALNIAAEHMLREEVNY